MKKMFKKSVSLFLALLLIAGCFSFSGFAREKTYHDYGSYVLLGDSVASGWSDVEERETRFVRVEGSYGAFVADDLNVTYHPMACIGFRTTELRYIFEDDFEADRFLFYSISDEEMERRIPEIRKAVSEAGLITLNVGGNDWGSFLGWHVFEEMDKFEDKNEAFMTKAEAYLKKAGTDENTINTLIDIASLCGALPDIIRVLPKALKTGLDSFFTNWNYVIEDIYALNPDVTLLAIGMFDNMVQNQETADKNEAALLKISLSQAIVDYANKPMKEGAEKYGYTFIDTTGTVCEQNHPSTAGHRFIADKILEALPDASFPYTDVSTDSKEYKAVEYMYLNELMKGITENEFAPEKPLDELQLKECMEALTGKDDIISAEEDKEVTYFSLARALMSAVSYKDTALTLRIKSCLFCFSLIFSHGLRNIGAPITRGEAAIIIKDFAEI